MIVALPHHPCGDVDPRNANAAQPKRSRPATAINPIHAKPPNARSGAQQRFWIQIDDQKSSNSTW
jgi:hypothetical protein